MCLSLFSWLTFSSTIPILNRDFTSQPNTGTMGGSLLGTPFDGPIGSGPWNGSASGILNSAATPQLTISKTGGAVSGGSATIQGIVNTTTAGPVVSNSGFFYQSLNNKTYDPNSTYVLTAYVSSNSFANFNLLPTSGVGIALLSGANIVASSTTADPALVSVSLFFPNTYKLALVYTTGSNAPTDDIDVELFENPNGLASADVFSSVSFSNVGLTETNASATPEPATFGLAGIMVIALASIKARA